MDRDAGVVTSKGQIVIPAHLRRRLGIRKGTQVSFVEDKGRLILQPVTPEFIRALRGSLKRRPSALKYLLAQRKRERPL